MNKDCLVDYYDCLISKIYKLLPLKESENDGLYLYIEGLIRELIGNQKYIKDSNFTSLIGILEYLSTEYNYEVYRSDVFKCISIINKLKNNLKG